MQSLNKGLIIIFPPVCTVYSIGIIFCRRSSSHLNKVLVQRKKAHVRQLKKMLKLAWVWDVYANKDRQRVITLNVIIIGQIVIRIR